VATPDESDHQPAVDVEATPHPRRRWVRKLAFRLLAVTIAVAVTLGVVEAAFRILGYQTLYHVYANPDDFYVADAKVGWAYRPGATGEFVGPLPYPVTFRTHVRINSLGLRGPEPTPVPRGGLRVLALGDSWTSGLEVAENETYSAVAAGLLSQRLGVPVQVINAGVRGYGTDQAWLLYQERLKTLHPDVVVYYLTGIADRNVALHQMRRVFGKPAFVLGPGNSLHLIGQPVPDYPRCSEYRVADGVERRIDGGLARPICWLQMNLANHSAFFSFVIQRIQGNPTLIKALRRLGTYDEADQSVPAAGPAASSVPPPPAGAPDSAAPIPMAAATPVPGPASPPGPASAHAPAAPSPLAAAPTDPVTPPDSAPLPASPPLDYAHRLTSALVSAMAEDVRHDGARFVLAGEDADMQALDLAALERQGIPLVHIDSDFGQDRVVPNDGHPNALGHHFIGGLLADQIEPLLREVMASR
jgi:lysophospholipase L1-like esterase